MEYAYSDAAIDPEPGQRPRIGDADAATSPDDKPVIVTNARALRRIQDSVVARFASVGVVNTAVDFGLFVALFAVGLPAVAANFISTSAGMAVSFFGNRRFVFGPSDHRTREIALFVVVCGLGIWGIQPAVITLATQFLTHFNINSTLALATIPKLLAIGIAAVWNYLMYSRLVFRSGTLRQKGRGKA